MPDPIAIATGQMNPDLPPAREPNESDDHYGLRVALWGRDRQYATIKRRYTWAAGIAAIATMTAVGLVVTRR